MKESEKNTVQELAWLAGLTVTGLIWAIGGGNAEIAKKRADEVLSTTHDTQVALRKIEEIKKREGR